MALTATIGASGAPHVDIVGTSPSYAAALQRTVDGVTETLTATGEVWDGSTYTDWAPPPGRVITYSCSGETVAVSMPSNGDKAWLVDPSQPGLSVSVTVQSADEFTRAGSREIVDIPGRADLVAITIAPRKGRAGPLVLVENVTATRTAIDAVLKSNRTLWFSAPCDDDGLPSQWLSFGDAQWSRRSTQAWDQKRYLSLPYVQVGRPAPVPTIDGLRIRDLDMPIDSIAVTIDNL